MSIVNVENLQKFYGSRENITQAVNNISLKIEKGEFIGIMGASGSGKTTLLNCISTIDRPTAGHIFIEQKNITSMKESSLSKFRREKLGFIFQDFNLLDTMTAYENIALALTINKISAKKIDSRIQTVAKKLDITSILNKYPYQLSGGQKQRVAAARAIITNPAVILADEPTGALDSNSAQMLLESLQLLNQEMQATILMVTHDVFSASYCQRVLFLRDGKIYNELIRGDNSRKQFFNNIMDVIALLGGATDDR